MNNICCENIYQIIHIKSGYLAKHGCVLRLGFYDATQLKGMEHVPNIFLSFDKYLFLKVINILI